MSTLNKLDAAHEAAKLEWEQARREWSALKTKCERLERKKSDAFRAFQNALKNEGEQP